MRTFSTCTQKVAANIRKFFDICKFCSTFLSIMIKFYPILRCGAGKRHAFLRQKYNKKYIILRII